jgi:hypothetical protein
MGRTDINRVNGRSYAFEIKSGRDRPDHAELQTKIFSDYFEFVTLIVSNEQLYSNISENIGITKYELIDGEMIFDIIRRPKKNLELNCVKQLKTLPKLLLFQMAEKKMMNKSRDKIIKEILKTHSESEINSFFKTALKDKYRDKWMTYIKQNIISQ